MGCNNSKADEPKEESQPKLLDEGVMMFVKKVELFKRLPEEELPNLARCGQNIEFKEGDVIIQQGDQGNELFIIRKGSAEVVIGGKPVANLKGGDYFGENALLREEPRTATITAKSVVKALKITRADFVKLGLQNKLQFANRGAVGGGAALKAEVKAPSPKSADETALIAKALQSNDNLNTIGSMDAAKIQGITDVMWKETVAANTAIIKQGDMQADYFYVVQSGSFAITKSEDVQSVEAAVGAAIGTVEAGGSFGELALLYLAPRAATITATVESVVWVTARQQFKEVLMKSNAAETEEHLKYVGKCEVFNVLKDAEKKELAAALHEMTFNKDETIFDQGDRGTQFFLLIQGEVAVMKDGKELTKLTATADKVQYFGEKALETNEPRAATIKVTSPTAKTMWVDKESFEMLLGSLTELIKRGKDGTAEVKKIGVAPTAGDAKRFGNVAFKNLKKLGLLGCGGFGAVDMVEDTTSQETYALKALSKGFVVKSGMQQSVISEKNVQLLCDSVFVVKLYETYNGPQSLFFLLELALGGELYATYNKKNLWGNEKCAKFYVAGTVFAFEHLHSKKIVYRDLKPENLLLNDKGQVKLTDMGLAKVCVGKTFTTCGTPDYFAPELIASKGHNHAVDWWTLGILTYELMSGHPPFESATPMQIYSKVQKGINKAPFAAKLKGNCEALVKTMCDANPTERLPMKKGGTANIKTHVWFAGFSWDDMENLALDTPYKPQVKSKKDIQNFSASKEDMPPQVNYKDPGTGWDKDFATSK
eukprot:CAMPEP_0197657254 /NCGR_PEP_ID=MMETSP1338-20131121/44511_1 /TAXON_ID=43686 ORGANISM="Pelagodinium beii, Strain RCC1491" /NCGR_SAMPLE_ID=MMETSP1338 /ASSEMBLY_ACC=CAM_ASM_000754 /LENGTH=767 /DNA_ID=CAMNT_0043233583 /DNA_START=51 /DNA_END=2354 /DNA_ORIENTATION=-